MKRLLVLLCILLSLQAKASHIVGGEFELLHVSDFTYRLNMILYFDEKNGNQGARDQNVLARVFRKSDNQIMFDINLPFSSEENVEYTQPDCSNGEVVTSRFIYTSLVNLPPANFSDPEGYYVVWERCCRNYQITNIFSENPDSGGVSAGQTFYLEFPPVTKNGAPFVNSTPQLFPPLNDYACPNKLYYVDFAGTDIDGDSLVYSLSTPLNSSTSEPLPVPSARPHPEVQWRPGFGDNNVVDGNPDLKISTDGFLTATPRAQGLYVFAVKCEEYRDGVKHGEVRRDFQMLVVDQCPTAQPPAILGKRLSDSNFIFDNQMSINFSNTVPDDQRCIQVRVSDVDSQRADENFTENVSIRAIALNFDEDISEILPAETEAELNNGSNVIFGDICFPECPYLEDTPYEIGIVAYDDACSLPLSDTLKITVTVQPPDNDAPNFVDTGGNPVDQISRVETEGFNKTITVNNIIATDTDGDDLTLEILPQGFELEEAGITFSDPVFTAGRVETSFTWNLDCQQIDYNVGTEFEILLIVDDEDQCLLSDPDTLRINLQIELPFNTLPEIFSTDLGSDQEDYFKVEYLLGTSANFDVDGTDADNDRVILEAVGANFDMSEFGAVFPGAEGSGTPPGITSPFDWPLTCSLFNLDELDSFRVYFTVEDFDKCAIDSKDTLTVDFKMVPPPNLQPSISFVNNNSTTRVIGNSITTTFGDPINLSILGLDKDNDVVGLELVEIIGETDPGEFSFEARKAVGSVQSPFLWNPECTIFRNGAPEANFTFLFMASDEPCVGVERDTLALEVTIKDIDARDEAFLPPNVFSPNKDNLNEFFAVEGINPVTNQPIENPLPLDNCAHRFERVRIFNRWGGMVYTSGSRDFRWYGEDVPAGVYYYHIKFTNDKEYTGWVSVVY